MSQTVKDMTLGKPASLIIGFAVPVFISQLFQQLYNTADTLIVGHFLGTQSVAAVTSAGNMVYLLVSFFSGFAMGAGILVSRFFGAKEEENVSKAIHTNLTIGFITGVILSIIGFFFCPVFLRWMNVDNSILELASNYYKFYFAGILGQIMYNLCTGTMNALGDSKRPLYYLIFSSVLNIILDTVFIAVFNWGVWSAALATVISQMLSALLCLIHLAEKNQIYTIKLSKMRIDGKMAKQMFVYGFPSAVQNSVIGFANVIVQSQINSFGMIATASFGIRGKIENFGFLPINSFTMALTTYVGQNLGAREYERTKKGAAFGIVSCVIFAELVGVLVYIFCPSLISIFDSNPLVIEMGTQCERIMAFFYCFLAFSHSIAAVCRGAGKATVPMAVMLGDWCLFRILYIYNVMKVFGEIVYIYWAYPITWIISSVIFFIYYKKSNWLHGFDSKP